MPRIMIGELHPLSRHPVDVRRLDNFLSETSQVSITEIVGHDINDVRLFGCFRRNKTQARYRQQKVFIHVQSFDGN